MSKQVCHRGSFLSDGRSVYLKAPGLVVDTQQWWRRSFLTWFEPLPGLEPFSQFSGCRLTICCVQGTESGSLMGHKMNKKWVLSSSTLNLKEQRQCKLQYEAKFGKFSNEVLSHIWKNPKENNQFRRKTSRRCGGAFLSQPRMVGFRG